MKRKLYQNLIEWKNSSNRKPLLLQGARQVGKTYLVNKFGKSEYASFISLNFEQNIELRTLFQQNLNPARIINDLGLYLGQNISANNTLIFFDEVQAAPEVLTSLKFFYEQAPEFHIIAAGSLLGVSIGKQSSFPVGKVNFMTLHPMNFMEFLAAFGEELLADKLNQLRKIEPLADILHEKILTHFKMYLYLGGMPEVVQSYLNEKDIALARSIQNDILEAYQRDFSKYTDKTQAIKTSELWNSIPSQLAKENKKFKYSDVRKKARAQMFEQTIEWLKNAGLINVVYNIETPKIPLTGYANHSKFKIYLLDTGLLGAMLNLTSDIIIKPNALFKEYNGAFIENFATSELISVQKKQLFYWTSKSAAEVDFVFQAKNEIYPLEIKSGTSRMMKSLRSYKEKYNPNLIFRASPRNFIKSETFVNLPLYAVSIIENLIPVK